MWFYYPDIVTNSYNKENFWCQDRRVDILLINDVVIFIKDYLDIRFLFLDLKYSKVKYI